MPNATPFLRWAGSKKQIVSVLAGFWQDGYDRYVEPFLGSGCLFFHLAPHKALLADINRELIEAYRLVKTSPKSVSRVLYGMSTGETAYYKVRGRDPQSLTPTQRAARFIYLNRFCFNGLYRTNQRGKFNVPFGGQKSGTLASQTALLRASAALKRVALVAADFEKVLQQARPGDFVYMDPPFSIRNRRVFKEYDPAVFGANDVVRLRGVMEALADSKISFIVSYLHSEEADLLKRGFDVFPVTVRRNIAGFLGSRTKCQELVISYRPKL